MTTFATNRPDIKKYLLYQVLMVACIMLTLLICEYAFPQSRFFKDFNYLLIGIITSVVVVIEIMRERIYEISFDNDKKQISFAYKRSAFSKLKRYDLPYDVARVERGEDTAIVKWLTPPSLYFLKNKLEVFKIYKQKDGFSNKALHEIYNTCVQIYLTQKNPTHA